MGALTSSRRGLLGAMALAPMGLAIPASALLPQSSSSFEVALRTYYRLRDADRHDATHGTLKAAYDRYERLSEPFNKKYARPDLATGDDKLRWEEHWKEMTAAEERHTADFSDPRWDAFEDLLEVPAPSVAALLLKINLSEEEEITQDDALRFIKADVRALAKGGLI